MAAVAAAREDAFAAAAAAATTLTRARSEAASHPRAPGVDAAVHAAAAAVDRARAAAAAAAADHEALRARAAATFEALPPAARRLFGPAYGRDEGEADVVARLAALVTPNVPAVPFFPPVEGATASTDVAAAAAAVAELHTSRFNRRGVGVWVGASAAAETAATAALLRSLLPASAAALRGARLPPDVTDWWLGQGVFAVSFGGATPVGAHDTVLAALHPRLPVTARVVWAETHSLAPAAAAAVGAAAATTAAGWDAWRRRLTADLTAGSLAPADVDAFCAGLLDAGLPADGVPAGAAGAHTRAVLLVDGLGTLAEGAGAAAAAATRAAVVEWAATARVRVVTGDVSPVAGGGGKGGRKAVAAAARRPKLVVIGAD